jgi:hypothetical protein
MNVWARTLWPWSVDRLTGIAHVVAAVRLLTSRHRATAANGAGSTRTRQTGERCTGAAGTAGSSLADRSAMDAALSCARRMTATPQAARSADAMFAPAGTDAAALELLVGFSQVLAREEHGAHVDKTRDSLGVLLGAVLDTIDEIAGVPE